MDYEIYRGVLNTDIIDGMVPSGELELPTIFRTNARPKRLIPFDKAIPSNDHCQFVHFFIHDYKFARLWRDPWKYLPILARFDGVIAPDFSVFWDYPLYMQIESVARSRMVASWLQRSGVDVIPCARWGKEETYGFAFDGIERDGTVAVGTVGCMRSRESREVFMAGLPVMLDVVSPKRVVLYGAINGDIERAIRSSGVELCHFASDTAIAHSRRAA